MLSTLEKNEVRAQDSRHLRGVSREVVSQATLLLSVETCAMLWE